MLIHVSVLLLLNQSKLTRKTEQGERCYPEVGCPTGPWGHAQPTAQPQRHRIQLSCVLASVQNKTLPWN